jgi:hypothetical protein
VGCARGSHPDRAGLALYLRGRGPAEEHAHSATRRQGTPMVITKRAMIGWARKAPARRPFG